MIPKYKRIPHAVEMTQRVVGDLGEFLRDKMPPDCDQNHPFEYDLSIQIRDGEIPLITIEIAVEESEDARLLTTESVAAFILRVEKWLRRRLPSALVRGFHGKVCVRVGMSGCGKLRFRQKVGYTTKYSWHNNRVGATV